MDPCQLRLRRSMAWVLVNQGFERLFRFAQLITLQLTARQEEQRAGIRRFRLEKTGQFFRNLLNLIRQPGIEFV